MCCEINVHILPCDQSLYHCKHANAFENTARSLHCCQTLRLLMMVSLTSSVRIYLLKWICMLSAAWSSCLCMSRDNAGFIRSVDDMHGESHWVSNVKDGVFVLCFSSYTMHTLPELAVSYIASCQNAFSWLAQLRATAVLGPAIVMQNRCLEKLYFVQ